MSQGIKYWYNVLLAEKLTYANLAIYADISSVQDLIDNPSAANMLHLDFWVIATLADAMDTNLDMQLIEMEKVAAKSRYGTLPWYVEMAKEFQYGDALAFADLQWSYPVIDATKQVVQLAAAQEGDGRVNLKIASIVAGVAQPLTTAQFNAIQSYFQDYKKPPGIRLNIINDNPDDLQTQIVINYDPLVLTSAGELISSPGTFPAQDAREAYLKSLDFNGIYEIMTAIDFLQQAQGVKSAYIVYAAARYGANPFVQFDERYLPNAGYLKTHVSSTITYNPNV